MSMYVSIYKLYLLLCSSFPSFFVQSLFYRTLVSFVGVQEWFAKLLHLLFQCRFLHANHHHTNEFIKYKRSIFLKDANRKVRFTFSSNVSKVASGKSHIQFSMSSKIVDKAAALMSFPAVIDVNDSDDQKWEGLNKQFL